MRQRDRYNYPGRWRPPWVAAAMAGRSEQTIRTWQKQQRVRSACLVRTRELLVHLDDVRREDQACQRRQRVSA